MHNQSDYTVDLNPYLDNTDTLGDLSCIGDEIAVFSEGSWMCGDLNDIYWKQDGNSWGETGILGTNDYERLSFETNGTTRATFTEEGHFLPENNDIYDLGSDEYRWRNLYLGGKDDFSLHIGEDTTNEMIMEYHKGDSYFTFQNTVDDYRGMQY